MEVRLAQDWGSLFILGLSYDDYSKIDSDALNNKVLKFERF